MYAHLTPKTSFRWFWHQVQQEWCTHPLHLSTSRHLRARMWHWSWIRSSWTSSYLQWILQSRLPQNWRDDVWPAVLGAHLCFSVINLCMCICIGMWLCHNHCLLLIVNYHMILLYMNQLGHWHGHSTMHYCFRNHWLQLHDLRSMDELQFMEVSYHKHFSLTASKDNH